MLNLLRKLWHSATGPSVPIRRPEGVSRRDFLRSMGVTTMSVAVGGMGSSLWRPLGKGKVYGARGEVIEAVKQPSTMIEFYAYETQGAAIGHTKALLKADLGPSAEDRQRQNARLLDQLFGGEQEAIDAVNAFTRVKMREDGFFRKILPPIQITNDHLDRAVLKTISQWGRDEIDEQTRREVMELGWRV